MPFDTTREADSAQLRVYRRLSGADRLGIALELSQLARDLAITGIRQRHPDATAADVLRELRRLTGAATEPAG